MNRTLSFTLLILCGSLAALPSCGGADDAAFGPSEPAPGAERGPCRSGGDCDPGLECRSNLCVGSEDPSSGGTNGTGGSSLAQAGTAAEGATAGSPGISSGGGGASQSEGGIGQGGAGLSEGGTGPGKAGGAGGAPLECEGSHPLLSSQSRFCPAGACYCNDPFDTCFPADTAQACCENTPRCGDEPGDRGVNCSGKHPIIEPIRTCESGYCFCSDGDTGDWDVCLPEAVAAWCCPPGVSLTCVE
jgi:hypothetical protein